MACPKSLDCNNQSDLCSCSTYLHLRIYIPILYLDALSLISLGRPLNNIKEIDHLKQFHAQENKIVL